MTVVLIILALLAGAVGFALSSQATMGVAIICGACLLAILARVAQASAQHDDVYAVRELLKEMNARENQRDRSAATLAAGYPPIR
jgi:hypothetical protein